MKKLMLLSFLFVSLFASTGCGGLDVDETDQWNTGVAVSERLMVEVKSRITADTPPSGINWNEGLMPQDVLNYLKLNLRSWVAWGIKNGAVSPEAGKSLLDSHGIQHKLE